MERLKQLRAGKGIFQKDIAEFLGIDRTTYVKYESGTSEPSIEMILRLADYFHVTTDYLLNHQVETPENVSLGEKASSLDGFMKLNEQEKELVSLYRVLNSEAKSALMTTVRGIAGNPTMQKDESSTETA